MLVKNVIVQNGTNAAVQALVIAGDGSRGANVNLVDQLVDAYKQAYFNSWIALNPGQYIVPYAAAAGLSFWVSGAILAGAPMFAIPSRDIVNILPVETLS